MKVKKNKFLFLLLSVVMALSLCTGCLIQVNSMTESTTTAASAKDATSAEKATDPDENGTEDSDKNSETEDSEKNGGTDESGDWGEEEVIDVTTEATTESTTKATKKETTKATEKETEPSEAPIDENGEYNSKDEVALYIYTYGHLPSNYVTKKEARDEGWEGGSLEDYFPGCSIGGDVFGNREGILPKKNGRTYYECDIDTKGKKSRGAKRIVFSNDGLIYYPDDHYETFTLLYGEENL